MLSSRDQLEENSAWKVREQLNLGITTNSLRGDRAKGKNILIRVRARGTGSNPVIRDGHLGPEFARRDLLTTYEKKSNYETNLNVHFNYNPILSFLKMS